MFDRLIEVFLFVLVCCLLMLSTSVASFRLNLALDDIKSPAFEAKSIKIQVTNERTSSEKLNISIDEINTQAHAWRDIVITCPSFQLGQMEILCTDGQLDIPGVLSSPVSLHFIVHHSLLKVNLQPQKKENWQFKLKWDETSWYSDLEIDNGRLSLFTAWLPQNERIPKVQGGIINGNIQLNGNGMGITAVTIDLSVDEMAFADQTGLHAGENITLALKSEMIRSTSHHRWQWRSDLYWQQGEVFWQPVYMAGNGHHLKMQGFFDEKVVSILDSRLILADVGIFNFSGIIDRSGDHLVALELTADDIELSILFEQLLKPFLRDTAFAELQISGQGDLALRMRNNSLQSVNLELDDVDIVDEHQRFAFHRINAHIPWQADGAQVADISFLSGHVLQIPLGSVRVPLEINDSGLWLPQLSLPVLDNTLKLADFNATYTTEGWRWKFSGQLLPVSMKGLTAALQIQQMHGTLSGYIPEVLYDGNSITVNGVLQIEVFDGSVVIHNLVLVEPMGLVPHLKADIAVRDLDLELLTRTFSFGKVEGRVDIDVQQLELASWKPVRFDARLFSSQGHYSRRISQKAIKNLSALGGEGAVVAIQKSFLRFFEEFRYSEIGWRCALRFNICYMGGIEAEPQSSYTLIKGSGIPSITVIGYNRNVGWQELINRLQRITQENKLIIQ